MKTIMVACFLCLLMSCSKSGSQDHHHDGQTDGENPNRPLYDQVIAIHDEVMPRMEDIYRLKKSFLQKLGTPGTAEEKKKELTLMVAKLDSANDAMMDWMHKFVPPPDSTDVETARSYYENEIERIKKVRDLTNETIEKANKLAEKNN